MPQKRIVTEKYLQNIAAKHGGKCLSKYKNARTPLLWQCKNNHKWSAQLYSIEDIGALFVLE